MPEGGVGIGDTGTLVTYTVIRKPPAAFAGEGEYAVCVVDMDAGQRVTGRLSVFEPEPALGIPVAVVETSAAAPVFAAA